VSAACDTVDHEILLNRLQSSFGLSGSLTSSLGPRLNPSKTKYIWLGTRHQLAKFDLAAIAASFPQISFSVTVRDLVVTLDQELTSTACAVTATSLPAASAPHHLPLTYFYYYFYTCPCFCLSST